MAKKEVVKKVETKVDMAEVEVASEAKIEVKDHDIPALVKAYTAAKIKGDRDELKAAKKALNEARIADPEAVDTERIAIATGLTAAKITGDKKELEKHRKLRDAKNKKDTEARAKKDKK